MDDRLRALEGKVDALSARVAELTRRVRALEGPAGADLPAPTSAAPRPVPPTASALAGKAGPISSTTPAPWPPSLSIARILTLSGRTFLVLGGAFLLRTITDEGFVPRDVGILLGLAYAVASVLLAGRVGRRDAASAGFHAFAAVVIAYPIVCEAATAFHALSPATAALLLLALTALGFAIAGTRHLRAVGWLHSLGATLAAVFLLFATRQVAMFAAFLLVLGMGTLWLGWARGWNGPRWVTAGVLDLAVAWCVSLVTDAHGLPEPYAHVSAGPIRNVALALPILYLGSFVLRTASRTRTVGPFEIAQAAAALLIGYGGAARITSLHGGDDAALGVASFLAGAAAYAVTFAFVRRQQGRNRNFFFYSSLALVLVLVGAWTTASPGASSVAMGCLALVTAVLGGRFDRVTVRAHAAVYAFTAAWQSGLLRFVADAFASPPGSSWAGPSGVQGVVLALLALSYAALALTRGFRRTPHLARIPRFTIGVLTAGGLAAVVLAAGLSWLFRERATMTPSDLAAARTVVLAAFAVGLAGARRASGLREMGWPVYPLLVLGGAKLLLEDIPHGGPMTLFLAFATYGVALLVAPRLVRAAGERATSTPSAA